MSGLRAAMAQLARNRLAAVGLALCAAIALVALAAPLLPLPDPNATAPADRLLRPGAPGHPLGTDHLGRDILSRLVWGARVSIAVGLSATAIAAAAGSLIGLVAGYAGGRVDGALMRAIDVVMAFPYILLALGVVAVLGPGLMNALFAIAVVNVPFFARTIRGVTLGLSRREFVEAARLSGASHATILFSEVAPNVAPVIVVTMSTTVGWMILETAGLSFLGLGAQPPQADLGAMLGEGRGLLFTAPHVSVIPGVVIFALVMSINLLGDGVRDALDPRLKAGALAAPGAATAVRRSGAGEPAKGEGLAVSGLVTEFASGGRSLRALDGVDFAVAPGERLALVGESGSGKSVAALSLTRLVPSPPGAITAGRVDFAGEDLLAAAPERLRRLRGDRVAYIFQDPLTTLHPLFTVGAQVAEALRAHAPLGRKAAREKAAELLEMVRIPAARRRLDAYPHELSGGMRQRACIAMALANDPALLIADEPTTALDVTVQAQVLDLMRGLAEARGTAVLFITHDFGVVSALCDRVAVMYAGRIVESGPTAQVLADPAHPYTAGLIACVPVLGRPDRALAAIEGLPPAPDALPPGCPFAPRCPHVEARCEAARPPLAPVGEGRAAACVKPLAGAA
ncbi:dipeptide/oligopeptide/nickel ABC transporter permease/ATP-binding protein [Rubrimonas cliftonensis]|uniref:Peptide/nickel transport system permease protein n=1 Tax=Rubrimonas cliftonensis TaxID=89524 RepID=A0A1H3XBY0_9RHOB|nr:dipeptide/oligopeptide/nickel ABC transporter permease/ATP-binding protein [Rubrimonas cliftonensis]SDZ96058.1 peptide/nickel transport system permease protein [Rubrimonas cliftonensis]